MRVPDLQRERAAILYLRRKFSYSINTLAQAFSRSSSLIHRILKFNKALGALTHKDLRWLPARVKKLATARMQRQLRFFMKLWMPFILGESDRPP